MACIFQYNNIKYGNDKKQFALLKKKCTKVVNDR